MDAERGRSRSPEPVRPTCALIPVIFVVAGLVAAAVLHLPYYAPLAAGALLALFIGWRAGNPVRSLAAGLADGVRSTWTVVSILTLIGGAIAVWTASGTIPAMIAAGLRASSPETLILVAFLVSTAVSMMLGTAIGTVSTVGIALLGIAGAGDLPIGWVAGAVVSGAVIGDRTSPVSSAFHLGVTMTKSRVEHVWRSLFPTTWRAFALSFGVYSAVTFVVGSGLPSEPQGAAATSPDVLTLLGHFHLPWVTLVPPVLVLLLAALRVRIGRALLTGMVLGALLAVAVQGAQPGELLRVILFGFELPSDVSLHLPGGGLVPMAGMMATVVCAGAFYGVMERAGMVDALFESLLNAVTTPRAVSLLAMLVSVAVGMVACNQTLAVILPGRMLGNVFDGNDLPRERLMQLISDSGVPTAPLIPWNLMAILIQAAIGVPVATFAPYAVFLWILPLVAVVHVLRQPAGTAPAAAAGMPAGPALRTKM